MHPLLLAIVFAAGQSATIALTKPAAQVTRSTYQPVRLELVLLPQPQIQVVIRGNDGKDELFTYPCPLGECVNDTPAKIDTLIELLNTRDLSTRSLWRRVFDRLCADFPSRFPGGCTVQ